MFRLLKSASVFPYVLFLQDRVSLSINTGTCIQQGDLFYSAGLYRNRCLQQPTQEKRGKGFGKIAGESTGRVEISKEEIPGSKRNMYGYKIILTYSRV